MLTTVKYPAAAGINNIEYDAVRAYLSLFLEYIPASISYSIAHMIIYSMRMILSLNLGHNYFMKTQFNDLTYANDTPNMYLMTSFYPQHVFNDLLLPQFNVEWQDHSPTRFLSFTFGNTE